MTDEQHFVSVQSLITASLVGAIIGAVICYAVLTDADPTPEPIDPETYRIEERIKLRNEAVQPELVKDSLEAVKSTISARKGQRGAIDEKWAEKGRERVNAVDSVLGVELITRIENWER